MSNHELVRVHGDPHLLHPDERTNHPEFRYKVFLPVKYANRVGCEWYKIGGDPEKKDTMRCIIFKYRAKARKIPSHSTDDICFGIGSEPKCPVSTAGDGIVDAGIPDLHRHTSVGYAKKGVRCSTITGEERS